MMPGWLIDAWKAYLGPRLQWLWESLAFCQALSLLLITLAAIAIGRRRWLAEKVLGLDGKEHDRGVFKRLNARADREFIKSILHNELTILVAEIDRVYRLWDFTSELQEIDNRYVTRALRGRAGELVRELLKLRAIVDNTFEHIGDGRIRFHPYPIDQKVYEADHVELKARIGAASDAFSSYRTEVKTRLME